MAITSIQRDLPNNVSLVRLTSTDTIAASLVAGYMTTQIPIITQLNNGVWDWRITDMLVISTADGLAFFQFTDNTFSTLVQYPASDSSSSSNNYIYVSNTGNDTTGNGSFNEPFLTVAHALTQITTNSASNPFTIYLIGGVVTDTVQVNFKPYVSVVGVSEGTVWSLTAGSGLDASWQTAPAQATMNLSSFSFISGDISLDFSGFSNVSQPILFVHDIFTATAAFTVIGGNGNWPNIFLTGCLLQTFNFDTAFVQMHACEIIFLNGNADSLDPVTNSTAIYCMGCTLQTVTLTGYLLTPNTFAAFYACRIIIGLTGNGATVAMTQDVSTYFVPTLVAGATCGLTSISNGLDANYTAVNYIPVATPPDIVTSTHAHLRGIDSALTGNTNLSKTVVAPTTGGTVTLSTANRRTILNPAGTLATLTINMPPTPANGQLQTVSTTQTLTALTVSGNGHTIIGQPTALTAGSAFTMTYDLATTTWYIA